ncbi:hypothetical protein CYMTET_30018 [Cymbomonas tetramitiformis]|uniref:Uncharacterized protein n=1 Tax=Cymbomonas tetramitiformis TaxID=36881 RepID=A0AAE0KUB7_9CHLO|nr:hypothetical protein CYMTET_30018 [Cymbomonas tetramitiformis]
MLLPFSVSTGLLLPLVFSQITDSIADGDLGEDAIYTVIFLAMLAVLCFLIPLCKLMLEDPNGRLITLCSGQGCSLLAVILTPVMASLTKSAIDDNPNVRWAAIGISAILLGIAQAVWEYAVPLTVSEFFTGQMAPFVCSALSAARFQLLASLLLGLYVSGMVEMDLYYSLGAMAIIGAFSWFLLAWEMDGESDAVRTREAGQYSRTEVDWDDVESPEFVKGVDDSEPEESTEDAHAKIDTESDTPLALPSTTFRSLMAEYDDTPRTETAHLEFDSPMSGDDAAAADDVASIPDTISDSAFSSLPYPGADMDRSGIATTWRSAADNEENSPVNFAERL